MPLVDGCVICNGRGEVAAGQACPVCSGTGVATAEQAAQYRQLLVDAAVQAATERFAQAGTNAAEGVLRGLAQARDDARETTARAGEVLEALKAARQSAWIAQQAALRVMGAETLVTRAEAAASRTATILAGPLPPDPTDPPPGIVLPAGMGGEIYYFDSLLVRQMDVWGNLNVGGSGGLLANPMTTLGDIITGGVAGAAQRLGIGGANQVLTVVGGVPAWANSAAGFANPMTTSQDLIVGGVAGAAGRLGVGANGQVLSVVAGLVAWANSPAGFANPMTTLGDIITGGAAGAAGRLGIGAAGQVLTVVAGAPAWQTNPAGFTNPMTSTGDMIKATAGGAAVRLAAGTAGQWLQSTGSPVTPTWSTMPFLVVPPSGDTTGAQDITNLNAAFTALSNSGTVWLLPNSTYYIGAAGLSVPPYVDLRGNPQTTIINCVGNGTGVYILQFNSANPQGYTRLSGGLHDFIVDGAGAGNGAVGISLQDVNSGDIRVAVRGFTGTGSIGLQIANNTHSLNNLTGFARVENCTTCVQFTALGAQTAIEHIYVVFNPVVNAGQNAFVLANSVGVQGSNIIADVGVLSTSAGPVISFGTSCVFSDCNFLLKAELTNPAVSASTVSFTGAGSGFVRTTGILFFSPNLLASNVVAQNGQVKHFGSIINESSLQGAAIPPALSGTYDQSLVTTPAFPGASGTAVQNNTGVPVWVTVAGGTLSAATVINGVNIGDVNTRVFMVPRTQSITLTWSAAPTGWVWQPVG